MKECVRCRAWGSADRGILWIPLEGPGCVYRCWLGLPVLLLALQWRCDALSSKKPQALTGVVHVDASVYHRSIAIGAARGCVSVRPGDGNALEATIRVSDFSHLSAIVARPRRVFDLAADPLAIGEHLKGDSLLAGLVTARPGIRVAGPWDGFERAVRTVLCWQCTDSSAQTGAALVAALGEPCRDSGAAGITRQFPDPAQVSASPLDRLGISVAQRRAIAAIARMAVVDPHAFDAGDSLEEGVQRLTERAGVDEPLAHEIALRLWRETDVFAHQDEAVLRAVAGCIASVGELIERAEAWRPWRAYAANQLRAAMPSR
ncbi:DNA-3-methyladenine glycosylase family protein [Tahibacter amnicola]|uniref:DNA-3-methyladenine glycosylase AlkA N-terminal domain-containing protein n=1 Tax=Tahibacter amnicola TaxID=2976241 RepID=A0ABY6BL60_9GAMM|nr:AlkA N-terminal domain-containing protein [Tahibacter amnicola]UXI69770.1 hypothetical protein N4264_09105 [Tahibacter amnicola]